MPKPAHSFYQVADTGCLRTGEVPQIVDADILAYTNSFQRHARKIAEGALVVVTCLDGLEQQRIRRSINEISQMVGQLAAGYAADTMTVRTLPDLGVLDIALTVAVCDGVGHGDHRCVIADIDGG